MDIRLFAAVMSRFKMIAIPGLLAAVLLAGLAYMRAGGAPAWNAQAEVLITQANDPYGGPTTSVLQEGAYLSNLASVYAAMANGDPVQALVRRAAGVPNGVVDAAEVVDAPTGNVDPLITLTSSAGTASGAVKLAEQMPTVLQQYIARQQHAGNVPQAQRVQLDIVKQGFQPELASSTSITVPALVFMGVLGAVITLIFMLENLNPKTAEKLGLVDTRTSGASSSELATALAALAQNLQPTDGAASSNGRTRNGHGGSSVAPIVRGSSAASSQGTSRADESGAGGRDVLRRLVR